MGKRTTLYLAVLACLTILAAPAAAGPLNGNADAIISGSTPFANGNLNGYVDWAVFSEAHYPFDTTDWTPTANELVYAYQVYSTGTDAISSYSVPVLNPADHIGSFADAGAGMTGVSPSDATLDIGNTAHWTFADPNEIPLGDNSTGLVYSSPNVPEEIYSIIVNGGGVAIAIPVPTPSSESIPEPGTCALLLVGLAVLGITRFTRRK